MQGEAVDQVSLARSGINFNSLATIEYSAPNLVVYAGDIHLTPLLRWHASKYAGEGLADDFMRALPDYKRRGTRTEFNHRNAKNEPVILA